MEVKKARMEVENGEQSLGTTTKKGAVEERRKVKEKTRARRIKKEHNVGSHLLTDVVLHDVGWKGPTDVIQTLILPQFSPNSPKICSLQAWPLPTDVMHSP